MAASALDEGKVLMWRKTGEAASSAAPEPFYMIPDLPIGMRDQVILRGDLYLPSSVPQPIIEAYTTAHLSAKIEGDGESSIEFPDRFPVVVIRTPYDKTKVNPDMRHPAVYWVQHNYACFIQDVRGRFKSDGVFFKYVNESEDGYDTVEWLARQPWCNEKVCTFGVSYLAHVQTSMALLSPPSLCAMYIIKGGFFSAFESGIRRGGALEARQWIWAIKNGPDSVRNAVPASHATEWMRRFPFKRGDSPLRWAPDYEKYMYEFVDNYEFGAFWERAGLSVKHDIENFARVPTVFISGWYDVYADCAVQFFQALSKDRASDYVKEHLKLIMGPWAHQGQEVHTVGDVDFGMQANLESNIAVSRIALARQWFDQFASPPPLVSGAADYDQVSSQPPMKLPPVLYFRMGGGEGHRTTAGKLFHGGMWLQSKQYPPASTVETTYTIEARRLVRRPECKVVKRALAHVPAPPVKNAKDVPYSSATFMYDPRDPVPSIGGNTAPVYKNVLFPGAYDQREREDHFLYKGSRHHGDGDAPLLPLSARHDVLVYRTKPLQSALDVTGIVRVVLFVSSDCVDTDFTAMLVDEYPPSEDYPSGFAMNVTHGIQRCRMREGAKTKLMEVGLVYKIEISLYPTSNLFRKKHRLALYVSSSNYPHFDLNLNTGENSNSTRVKVAENTVWHWPVYASHVIIPEQHDTPPSLPTFAVIEGNVEETSEDDDGEYDEPDN